MALTVPKITITPATFLEHWNGIVTTSSLFHLDRNTTQPIKHTSIIPHIQHTLQLSQQLFGKQKWCVRSRSWEHCACTTTRLLPKVIGICATLLEIKVPAFPNRNSLTSALRMTFKPISLSLLSIPLRTSSPTKVFLQAVSGNAYSLKFAVSHGLPGKCQNAETCLKSPRLPVSVHLVHMT